MQGILRFFTVRPISFGPLGMVELAPIHIWGIVAAVILITMLIYFTAELNHIKKDEEQKYLDHFQKIVVKKEPKNERWETISKLIATNNPADWRVAIIEADSMLESMLTKLGYPGQSIGEKLSATNNLQFPTLEYAWEGHKVRNKIAHQGMQYQLDYREALHAYRCFEKVFQDAKYI